MLHLTGILSFFELSVESGASSLPGEDDGVSDPIPVTFQTDIDECLGPDNGCEHGCVNTIRSYNCNCTEGYKLYTDERTCTGIYIQNSFFEYYSVIANIFADINECLMELDECDQICENTPGFYRCDCNSGSMLMPDNHTCEGKLIMIICFI